MPDAPDDLPVPHTIDEVVDRLDRIIERAVADESRLGYFAAVYNRVTLAVRDGIRARAFADNARMERLDVAFARRYIEAYTAYVRRGRPTGSWEVAFDAIDRASLSVLQHLFLGMNAHIHLDLGIASNEVAGPQAVASLEHDFHRINDVLSSLVPLVEEQVGEITHRFTVLPHVSHGLDRRVVSFSMAQARQDAWRFAVKLSELPTPAERQALIAARDRETAALSRLFGRHGVTQVSGGADRSEVSRHIRVLARGEYGLHGADPA